jgi:orotate phosphoribosyltransferase
MISEKEILQILKDSGAYMQGHFLLSSGLHSDTYIQCAKLMERPELSEMLCKELASRWKDKDIDLVAGPAYGGIILSYELARELRARAIFFEREKGIFTLRRGFMLRQGERILLAEDVVTTGGSVKELIELIKPSGAEIVGITSIINRAGRNPFEFEFKSLIMILPPLYTSSECPLCKSGLLLTKPGSR